MVVVAVVVAVLVSFGLPLAISLLKGHGDTGQESHASQTGLMRPRQRQLQGRARGVGRDEMRLAWQPRQGPYIL